ncbi:hypothetical protein RAC89_07810 [Paenibacillus sp. GD4]|jgi:O-antigen/teichoic acid export membrane protein|uniref:lipopolysaccharide biosynthesis protein n=1 Tax=Paenibacillus sp. GD4 TaxID=3068890 RepID=UPI0027966B17|nr:hypothetical protein [Paenibacillus sp. GD4]MDQ1910401.1 hypothetical protein [Paenibacillus sp. GD4]
MDAQSTTAAPRGQARLLMQTLQTFLSMFGVLAINVFSAIILSRGLTPDDRGVYLGTTMWSGFVVGMCDIGIYMATIYLWGKCTDSQRKKDVFATMLGWALGTGVICVGIVAVLADYMIKGHLSEQERIMAYVYFASSFGGPVISMLSGVLAAEQRFSLINLVRIGVPAVLTSLWLAYFLTGALSVSLCLLTSSVIATAGMVPFLWQARAYLRSLGRFRWDIFKDGAWYGLRGYGGSVINVLGGSGAQIMLFALTPASLAFFQTATSATGVLWAIPKAIGITSFPDMVKEQPHLLHAKLCRFFRLAALATACSALLLGLAEPIVIPFFFGAAYTAAVLPALILLPNALFGGLSDLLGDALSSTGRTLHNTVATGAYTGATLGSMLFTLDAWGIAGAALSTLIGFMMSFLVRFVWYQVAIERIRLRDIVPGPADLQEITSLGLGIWRKVSVKWRGKLSV